MKTNKLKKPKTQKEKCQGLLPLVNDAAHYEILQMYVEDRLSVLRGFLETQKEHSKILEIQGAIAELRALQSLREHALEGAKR